MNRPTYIVTTDLNTVHQDGLVYTVHLNRPTYIVTTDLNTVHQDGLASTVHPNRPTYIMTTDLSTVHQDGLVYTVHHDRPPTDWPAPGVHNAHEPSLAGGVRFDVAYRAKLRAGPFIPLTHPVSLVRLAPQAGCCRRCQQNVEKETNQTKMTASVLCWLLFRYRFHFLLPQQHVKDPCHCAKSTGGS